LGTIYKISIHKSRANKKDICTDYVLSIVLCG